MSNTATLALEQWDTRLPDRQPRRPRFGHRPPAVRFVVLGLGLGMMAGTMAQEPPQGFVLHDAPEPVPEIRFQDGDGEARSLADFRGKVVLLNVWATWCSPCRHEVPSLDRLQAELGGADFEVVALSIDLAGIEVVTEFFAEVGVRHLAKYIDRSGKALQQLGAVGLPTTLLIDRQGRELGRLVGVAEWDTPEMVQFLRRHLSRNSADQPTESADGSASGAADRRGADADSSSKGSAVRRVRHGPSGKRVHRTTSGPAASARDGDRPRLRRGPPGKFPQRNSEASARPVAIGVFRFGFL